MLSLVCWNLHYVSPIPVGSSRFLLAMQCMPNFNRPRSFYHQKTGQVFKKKTSQTTPIANWPVINKNLSVFHNYPEMWRRSHLKYRPRVEWIVYPDRDTYCLLGSKVVILCWWSFADTYWILIFYYTEVYFYQCILSGHSTAVYLLKQ